MPIFQLVAKCNLLARHDKKSAAGISAFDILTLGKLGRWGVIDADPQSDGALEQEDGLRAIRQVPPWSGE